VILFGINSILIGIYTDFFGIPLDVFENSLILRIPSFLLEMSYQVYFLANGGATPGKRWMGLQVCTEEGNPIDYGKAFTLYWSYLLTALTLGIGFLAMNFDPQKRTLHDRLTKTKVIRIPR
jgi:uncharacterized RDD family membrane protein YckC